MAFDKRYLYALQANPAFQFSNKKENPNVKDTDEKKYIYKVAESTISYKRACKETSKFIWFCNLHSIDFHEIFRDLVSAYAKN